MNKPNWRDAPEWANWLAMDSGGFWHWYSEEPQKNKLGWWYRKLGSKTQKAKSGSWEDSAEHRP